MKRKIACGMGLGVLVILKVGLWVDAIMSVFFMGHLQYGTYINGIDVGGMKVSSAEKILEEKALDYVLTLEERGGQEEQIVGSDIGLQYNLSGQVQDIKDQQYFGWWMRGIWQREDYDIDIEREVDEKKLKESIDALECLAEDKSVAPENAGLELVSGKYEIIEGKEGNLVKKDKLTDVIKEAVSSGEGELSLEEKSCYEEAKIKADDKDLKEKKEALNRYLNSEIIYDFGDRQEVVDGTLISEWLLPGSATEVTLDEQAVSDYVDEMANTYDTLFGTRQFKTSTGNTVTVAGGDYGWKIDRQKEKEALIEIIKTGNQKVTRTPIYEYEGWCRDQYDIGNTYVEVNLTKQYLWFYVEGKLVTEGSIVSGTGSNSHATPEGTYRIDYKQANAVLRGPGYACPVSYWMPFNCGIGIHDAVWRSAFGGSIYVYNGSHGCINAPLSMAKAIFAQIEAGMPVVCYKED